jgi:peptidoglycan/LPS O-acetylase OafA/YrhL
MAVSELNEHNISKKQNKFSQMKELLTSLLEGNKPKSNIASLDSIRAIAILSVVFFHVAMQTSLKKTSVLPPIIVDFILAGGSGVTLFLVLSGFLLFLPYIKSLLFDSEWPSIRSFYFRRALRIWPGYYIALFVMIILSKSQYLQPGHWKHLLLFLTFFMDSSRATFQDINGPFWTLAVEWQFYIILPWLSLAMRPLVQRGSLKRRISALALCLMILTLWGLLTRYGGYYFSRNDTTLGLPHSVFNLAVALLYGVLGPGPHSKYLDDFAIGMLTAVCYVVAQQPFAGTFKIWLQKLSPWLLGLSILGLILLSEWNAGIYGSDPNINLYTGFYYEIFHELLYSLSYVALILGVLFGGNFITTIFEWSPFRWIGLISYSMYIWHNPITVPFSSAAITSTEMGHSFLFFSFTSIWVFIAVIPFSLVMYVLIERPFMQFSNRLHRSASNKPLVATSVPSKVLDQPLQV